MDFMWSYVTHCLHNAEFLTIFEGFVVQGHGHEVRGQGQMTVLYPQFSGRNGKEFAVNRGTLPMMLLLSDWPIMGLNRIRKKKKNRGNLRRLKYNKIHFKCHGPCCNSSWRSPKVDEQGILAPHCPPLSPWDPKVSRSTSELVPPLFRPKLLYATGFAEQSTHSEATIKHYIISHHVPVWYTVYTFFT